MEEKSLDENKSVIKPDIDELVFSGVYWYPSER
jgi:hypothetical protein